MLFSLAMVLVGGRLMNSQSWTMLTIAVFTGLASLLALVLFEMALVMAVGVVGLVLADISGSVRKIASSRAGDGDEG